MRLKSYFADSVEAAMTLAARELGDEALLVYSREASAETKYLGSYEVVFGSGEVESRPDQPLPVQQPAAGVTAAGAHPPDREPFGWASSALADLKNEIGFLRQDVVSHRRCVEDLLTSTDRRAWRLLADWGSEPDLVPGVALAGRLLQSDMDPEHVLDVIECTRDSVRSNGPEAPGTEVWKRCLERELIDRRPCNSRVGAAVGNSAIVLIGPSGSGKTTVAMQLTAQATSKGLDPKLIAFEPGRLTAAQTLRTYSAVLGAPFELARRAEHLATLLSSGDSGRLTIVDGPGLGSTPDDGTSQLAAFCKQPRQAEIWLVLPATLRASDLRLLVDRFSAYSPTRLVFSRTGEARHWGAVWSAAEWAGLPIAFFCDGPRVPEDLRAATGEAIAAPLIAVAPLAGPARLGRRAERASTSGRG